MLHVDTPQCYCRVGAAQGDITPPVGIYHRMWGAASHDRSTGVHRPLAAVVLVIRPDEPSAGAAWESRSARGTYASGGGVVLVSLDHCILGDAEIDTIRRSVAERIGLSPGDVHISLTHTHGAGLMMPDRSALPGGDLIAPYLEDLARRVAQLANDAERSLAPAWITFGTGRCNLAADRDFFDERRGGFVCGFNPGAPADDTLLIGRVTDVKGQMIATFVNYACHPTTLAWENTLISPDYVGAMREVIQNATGGVPCLFMQGASAELGPRDGFVGDTAVADRNGRQLGFAALSAMEALPPAGTRFQYKGAVVSGAVLGTWRHVALDAQDKTQLSLWQRRQWTVDLPYRADRPTLDQTRAEREHFIAAERDARTKGDNAAAQDHRAHVEQKTRQIMRLESLPPGDVFPLPVTAWRLGGALWIFVAGEHYSMLQTSLRRRFPNLAIIVATITDGWQPGYVPAAGTYGKGIYQETIAMVAAGSLDRLIEAISKQIAQWEGDTGFRGTDDPPASHGTP